jgi:hypothetical protein
MDWQVLDLNDIPPESGVYGFKFGDRWLYIGQSGNLKQRLNKQHIPLQIALEMGGIALFYCLTDLPRNLEKRLIRELQPEWNGGTNFEIFGAGPACKSGVENATFEEMEQALSFLTW